MEVDDGIQSDELCSVQACRNGYIHGMENFWYLTWVWNVSCSLLKSWYFAKKNIVDYF